MSPYKNISIKRVYEKPAQDDGYRVLIDRLWPRGLKKEKAQLDEWNKTVAPSTPLRKWFNHEEEKLEQFTIEYAQELLLHTDELQRLRGIAKNEPLTLLYAAKDPLVNHATVLQKYLLQGYGKPRKCPSKQSTYPANRGFETTEP